ncbi:hypothetical protein FJ934_25670 [Mesorhizobium sp. B2-4-12]|uniref:hypothetical protein n=1 Tax=unclassified Mesorhizobium TaxID=325217 RepID=UPI00112DE839|nr:MULTISPECIES: hypothetical protein [unclassified Mesorhizobium]TPK72243.1 hypothetical protein FJ548_28780 [Mesorhizobium sp. B2-4-17]TPK88869.1 hypothetical protein FJ934_25670 [Mesorhizobium sp. B2-4-12]TPK97859.1 hypothetical protein FJ938_25970 [Mesorhizobium sp. B2-4-14]UCI34415.1 hypothetical protein FJW03_13765 [Mesorhizobium sp. B4-1-4]
MVKNIDRALQDAILAMRILRKSIIDHGHLDAMTEFDSLIGVAISEAEQQLISMQARSSNERPIDAS